MKTLYLTNRSNIVVDSEDNSADQLNRSRQAIEDVYMITESIHVVYGKGDDKCEFDVETGDIIITFYDFKNKVIVVKNKEWFENLEDYEKREQENKLKWAAENKGKCCEACANTCF